MLYRIRIGFKIFCWNFEQIHLLLICKPSILSYEKFLHTSERILSFLLFLKWHALRKRKWIVNWTFLIYLAHSPCKLLSNIGYVYHCYFVDFLIFSSSTIIIRKYHLIHLFICFFEIVRILFFILEHLFQI